jgi:hypothetical protein
MCFVSIHESRRTKPVEIVLRSGKGGRGRMMERVNPIRYVVSTFVNISTHPLAQLLYASKKWMKAFQS